MEADMNRSMWLKRVNVVLFFFLLFQAGTALLSEVINPDVFEAIHPIGGGILVVLGLVHLGLNWGWVRSVVLAKKT
jgi:hypothetical protein